MTSRIRIYDNGGKTVDRYTLVVPSVNEPGKLDMYGFNASPYSPQGFGQFAGSYRQSASYSHLGKLVAFKNLSEQAQAYVHETLTTPLPDGYGLPLPDGWVLGVKRTTKKATKTRRSRSRSSSYSGLGTMR